MSKTRSNSSRAKVVKPPRLSRTQVPTDMTPVAWQRALRRQFGREQAFLIDNLGSEPVFSEFRVGNPESKNSYRVAIRGQQAGDNYCSCPDYASNELGTCKHIEFVLAQLEKKRGAKAAFKRGYQPAFSELFLRNDGGRSLHFRAGTDCPPAVVKAAGRIFDDADRGRLPKERLGALEGFLAVVAKAGHELRFYDDARDFVAGLRDAERRAAALDRLFPRGAADAGLKTLLKVPLYPYQAEGALFAVRAGRALIGDEMGLGKTIQAIAAAEILACHFGVAKVLVICPTSLKYQWQGEIKRFAGRDAWVIAGGRAQRRQEYARDDFCKITNYEKLQPDLDLIAAWAPDLVIVDEAQRVKNWNTIAARALKRINSAHAVVLTGTPLENKLEELISIVQFIDQHRLGPTWKLLFEHQVKDEAGRVTGYTGLEKIGQTLAAILMRRRKSEVLTQLPERTDQNLMVPMTEMQMAYHQENADVVAQIVNRWRKMKFLSDMDQRRLTCALQNMRMACNSTYLRSAYRRGRRRDPHPGGQPRERPGVTHEPTGVSGCGRAGDRLGGRRKRRQRGGQRLDSGAGSAGSGEPRGHGAEHSGRLPGDRQRHGPERGGAGGRRRLLELRRGQRHRHAEQPLAGLRRQPEPGVPTGRPAVRLAPGGGDVRELPAVRDR